MQPWHLPMTLLAFCGADCVMLMPTKPSCIHNGICVALPEKGITAWVKHSSKFYSWVPNKRHLSLHFKPPVSSQTSLQHAELAHKKRSSAGLGPKSPGYVFLVAVEARFRNVISLHFASSSIVHSTATSSWQLDAQTSKPKAETLEIYQEACPPVNSILLRSVTVEIK